MFPAPRRVALLCLAAAVAAACDSPSGSGKKPEPVVLPEIRADVAVTGTLAPADTGKAYTIVPPAADYQVLLQARSGSAADTLVAEVINAQGVVLAQVASVGTDAVLEAQGSGWVKAFPDNAYLLRVRRKGSDDDGAYTLQLRTSANHPETLTRTYFAVGQVVEGESMQPPPNGTDVDDFRVTGQAGAEWIVFAQSLGGGQLTVQLVDSATTGVLTTFVVGGATSALEGRSSGRVVLPSSGTWLVRVSASAGNVAPPANPYRFRIDAVNRAPETGNAARALGAVVASAIESVGDVDEFTFTAPAGQEINLLARLEDAGLGDGVVVDIALAAQLVARLQVNARTATIDDLGTGRVRLTAGGTYTVRVYGNAEGDPASNTGAYKFELYPVDRRPEAPAALGPDLPAVNAAVDRPGDVDEFTFTATAGQHVVLRMESTGTARGPLVALLMNAAGDVMVSAATSVHGAPVFTPARYSYRWTVFVTGTYTVRVAGSTDASLASGPYTLETYTVSGAPEHVPSTFAIGQVVTGERIDRPGDFDEFTFQGQADQVANFFLHYNGGGMFAHVGSAVSGPTTYLTRASATGLDNQSTGRIPMWPYPYQVRIDPNFAAQGHAMDSQGPYSFRVFRLDFAPEGRAAAYTLGDTVGGEPLYPAGDVDQYFFTLAEATPVRVFWEAAQDGPSTAVEGQLRTTAGHFVWTNSGKTGSVLVEDITLPAGSYRMDVRNPNMGGGMSPTDPFADHAATLPYRFAITPR